MVLKFYYDVASPPVRAVYFTIKNLGIPVEYVDINLVKGQHKSEEFLKINPLGTVPCIEDDGCVVVDSHAINIYLTTKYPEGEKLYPSDPKTRSAVNERLFFEACELFGTVKGANKKIIFKKASELDEDTIERFHNGYNGLEIYLKKSQYIAGDDLTIADFSVIPTLCSMKLLVPLDKEKYPSVTSYLERATTWPFYAEINEVGHNKLKDILKTRNTVFKYFLDE